MSIFKYLRPSYYQDFMKIINDPNVNNFRKYYTMGLLVNSYYNNSEEDQYRNKMAIILMGQTKNQSMYFNVETDKNTLYLICSTHDNTTPLTQLQEASHILQPIKEKDTYKIKISTLINKNLEKRVPIKDIMITGKFIYNFYSQYSQYFDFVSFICIALGLKSYINLYQNSNSENIYCNFSGGYNNGHPVKDGFVMLSNTLDTNINVKDDNTKETLTYDVNNLTSEHNDLVIGRIQSAINGNEKIYAISKTFNNNKLEKVSIIVDRNPD